MTAYNPPEFQFSGLIFNPLIYEQGEGSTSSGSSGTFVDLTTDNLYTNNIQGKTPSATTSLYTLSSGIVSLGGSILTAIYYITNVHFFYNALKDQLVSLRFNLYATDMISTDYYADIAGTALSVSVRASPQFTGDTTYANGVYSILAGTTRLLNLIKTSLEAPIHWLYNTAQTLGKSTAFGATTITETYYCDSALPTNPTANTQVAVSGLVGANNGNITTACGAFAVNSINSNVLTAPANAFFGAVSSIAISAVGVLGRTYRYGTNNVIERIKADTSQPLLDSGRIDWTPSLTTPAVANTGVYKLTAGEFQTTAPISPLYSYPLSIAGNIGYVYTDTTPTTGTFVSNAQRAVCSVAVPAGVYSCSVTIPVQCLLNNTLVYQQTSLDYGGSNFIAVSGIHSSGNPAVNKRLYSCCAGVISLSAGATITGSVQWTFNVVNAYTINTTFYVFNVIRIG